MTPYRQSSPSISSAPSAWLILYRPCSSSSTGGNVGLYRSGSTKSSPSWATTRTPSTWSIRSSSASARAWRLTCIFTCGPSTSSPSTSSSQPVPLPIPGSSSNTNCQNGSASALKANKIKMIEKRAALRDGPYFIWETVTYFSSFSFTLANTSFAMRALALMTALPSLMDSG